MVLIILPLLIFNLTFVFGQTVETVGTIEVNLAEKCEEEMKKFQAESQKHEESGVECAPSVSETVDALAMNMGDILLSEPADTLATWTVVGRQWQGQKNLIKQRA